MKNRKVFIFKDIKNKRWTVYDYETRKHLGYKKELELYLCEFKVIEDKRQRILKTKKRFPHAWVIGYLSSKQKYKNKLITYNPFENKSFMCKGKSIKKAKYVKLLDDGSVII